MDELRNIVSLQVNIIRQNTINIKNVEAVVFSVHCDLQRLLMLFLPRKYTSNLSRKSSVQYTVKFYKTSQLKNHYTLCEGSSESIYKRHKNFEFTEESRKKVFRHLFVLKSRQTFEKYK
jgi:hypothetical protein